MDVKQFALHSPLFLRSRRSVLTTRSKRPAREICKQTFVLSSHVLAELHRSILLPSLVTVVDFDSEAVPSVKRIGKPFYIANTFLFHSSRLLSDWPSFPTGPATALYARTQHHLLICPHYGRLLWKCVFFFCRPAHLARLSLCFYVSATVDYGPVSSENRNRAQYRAPLSRMRLSDDERTLRARKTPGRDLILLTGPRRARRCLPSRLFSRRASLFYLRPATGHRKARRGKKGIYDTPLVGHAHVVRSPFPPASRCCVLVYLRNRSAVERTKHAVSSSRQQ